MNSDRQFKFVSPSGKSGSASFDIVYPRILKYHDMSIITKQQYDIQTPISDEIFDSLIKFIKLESIPEITSGNVNEYNLLSQELKFR